jgi:hypothetical protein
MYIYVCVCMCVHVCACVHVCVCVCVCKQVHFFPAIANVGQLKAAFVAHDCAKIEGVGE